MSPILGIWASQNYVRVSPSYDSIATTTVGGGGTSTVTFSSIPGTYKHLQLRYTAQSTRGSISADNVLMQLNGAGSGYSRHFVWGDGANPASGATTSATHLWLGTIASTATANIFGVGIVDILDYANTNKNKTTRSLFGEDLNGTPASSNGLLGMWSGLYPSTTAVTSISLTCQSASFAQYTQFALYGIK